MNSNTFKFTLISGLLLFWNINYAQEDYDYDEEYEEVEYLSPLNDKSLGGQTLFVEELLDISGYILKSIEVYQNLPNNAKVFRVKLDSANEGGFVFVRWDKKKKENYVKGMKNPIDEESWIWLTGDSTNIEKVTENLGFKFKKEGKEYVHAAAIMVVSPHGKITRYLHGTYFLPFDLKMAIVESSKEVSGPTINKVLKFCFSYDPEGQQYVFNITKISGTLILSAALILLAFLVFKRKRNN